MQQIDTTEHRRDFGNRLRVSVHSRPGEGSTLAADVLHGMTSSPKRVPPKHFYDARGSELFDRICDTPEYYPTRTELGLLESAAREIIETVRPTHLIELGSGAARKTRALLDAVEAARLDTVYVPFDVSESMLVKSARELLQSYDWLRVQGVVGDYEHHLREIPTGERHLFVFLGGTIGNFGPERAVEFLQRVRDAMVPGDRLLLGTDLVKSHAVLNAAYNDEAGVTAEFNKNVLLVMNRELDADFDPDLFEHVAFFDPDKSQIEMHLRARRAHSATIGQLGLGVELAAGEMIHTEISRKFTYDSLRRMLEDAGLELLDWYVPDNQYFALSLSRPR